MEQWSVIKFRIENTIMERPGHKANISGEHRQLKGNSRMTHEILGFPERVTFNSYKWICESLETMPIDYTTCYQQQEYIYASVSITPRKEVQRLS